VKSSAKFALNAFLLCAFAAFSQTVSNQVAQISSALRSGNFEQAVEIADQGLAISPKDSQLWTLKGIALAAQRHTKEALDAYHHALKISPNYLPALEGAAQIQYEAGDKETTSLLQRITQLRPGDQTSHAMLGSFEYKQGNCADALNDFQKSEQLIYTQPGALQEYGACLLRAKQLDKAVVVFEKLLAAQPDNPLGRRALATVQFAAGQPQQAIVTLRPLIESANPDVATLQLAASAFEAAGDTPLAVKLLRDAIVKDPRQVSSYVDFANVAFIHQSFQAGIEMINSGLRLQPESAPLYLARGVLYVQVGDFDKAEADFDKAERFDPKHSTASIAQGLVAEEKHQNDPEQALAVVRSKLAKNPNDAFLLYLEAAIIQQKAPPAGSTEFLHGVEVARKAVRAQPSLANAHDVLASFYLQAGDTNLAIGECRAALEHNPKDQTALYHLIVALRRDNNKSEIPLLLKRLAEARQESTRQEAENNRYKLVVNSGSPSD
jgi:tetratricopeptide (TPR) repeat protein